jgi:H+-translocating NAD(P) transhydrogenase subunit beta
VTVAVELANLLAIALFIYGLHELNSPATARRGNRYAMAGMAIALIFILVRTQAIGWP